MNREQELQKEIENHKKVMKVLITLGFICISLVVIMVVTLCVYAHQAKNDKPEPTQRQIMPFQRDYEPEWYLYRDGTKGTLSHHPITHEKGVLIKH